MFNEARLSYTRYFSDFPVGGFTFPGLNQFPNLAFNTDLNLQLGPDPNAPQSTVINTYTFNDNLSKIIGRHTLKFGYDVRRVIAPQFFVQRVRGDYQYTTFGRYLFDQVPDESANAASEPPHSGATCRRITLMRMTTFRIRPNLTLNLGLRYEYVGVPAGNTTQALNQLPYPGRHRLSFAYSPENESGAAWAWSPHGSDR